MRKKSLLIVLAIVVLAAFGSSAYALDKTDNQASDLVRANKTDLYQQCVQNMPKDETDLDSWHQSPEHQTLHQQMMADTNDMQVMHNAHHGV